MIPQAIQITLPTWVQAVVVLSAIATNLSTALFVIFVLWPSIRNSERRGRRIERWVDSEEGKRVGKAILTRISNGDGLDSAGKQVEKGSWEGEGSGSKEGDPL